jgi:hypothetical protein
MLTMKSQFQPQEADKFDLLGIDDFFCFQPSLSLDDTDLVDILYF